MGKRIFDTFWASSLQPMRYCFCGIYAAKACLWQILCILSSSVAVANTSHFVILAPPNFPAITDALNKGCERAENELGNDIACDVIAQEGGVVVQNQSVFDSVAKGVPELRFTPPKRRGSRLRYRGL